MAVFAIAISVGITQNREIIIRFDIPASPEGRDLRDPLVGNLEGSRYGESAPPIPVGIEEMRRQLPKVFKHFGNFPTDFISVTLCSIIVTANAYKHVFWCH